MVISIEHVYNEILPYELLLSTHHEHHDKSTELAIRNSHIPYEEF